MSVLEFIILLEANGFKKVGESFRKSLSDNLELCWYISESFIRFQTKGQGFTQPLKGYSKENLELLIKG